MIYKNSRVKPWFCYFLVLVIALELTGCCAGKKKKKPQKGKATTTVVENLSNQYKDKGKASSKIKTSKPVDDIHVDLNGQLPLRAQDEHTSELYEKMAYANKMYKNKNYDAALREIERVQRSIDNDPYLEMQTWAMAAKVYDKTGKNSRRKRAYEKMIESLKELHKDPRFKKAYADGMECQNFIDAVEKFGGDKKYE